MSESSVNKPDSRLICICYLAAYMIVVEDLGEEEALQIARRKVDRTPVGHIVGITEALGVLATFVPKASITPLHDARILQVGAELLSRA